MGKLIIAGTLIYVLYKLVVLGDEINETTAKVCSLEDELHKALNNKAS